MKESIVDVNFTEVNNTSDKKYSTVEEVSKILSVEAPTIIFWCNKFNHMLNIQSIGMYKIFSENDIKNLKIIKKLNIDDNMNIGEIKIYLNQNKGVIIAKKEIEVPEVSLLTVIAKILSSQNEKIETLMTSQEKMMEFNQQLLLNQEEFMNKLSESQKEVSIDLESKVNGIRESQKDEIDSLKTDISKLNENISDKITLMEQEVSRKLLEREEKLKQHMETRKEEQKLLQDVESQKKKSIWRWLTGK